MFDLSVITGARAIFIRTRIHNLNKVGLLVDFNVIDRPISVTECTWVVLNIVITVGRATRRTINGASPITTEGQIKYNLKIVKVVNGTMARLEWEGSKRSWPCGWIRITTGDIRWDVVSREEPNLDTLTCGHSSSINATLNVVQTITIGVCVRSLNATTSIAWLASSIDVTVISQSLSSLCAGNTSKATSLFGM